MKSFLIHAAITIFILWSAATLLGRQFDKICVEGRLSAAQAVAINSLLWGKCPRYRDGNCEAEEGDRVFVGQCSSVSKTLFLR